MTSTTATPNDTAEHTHTNRLINETSPYLLQHAHNPVDWYPWGEKAFEAAREQDKPIFLSIGYSTCYWCHVMERESFENEQIAEVMNEHFINIKVDREARPDVDDIYMAAVHILNNGQGGWPMSVWLEPESLKPFFAGTYFPPDSRYGRPGFPDLLKKISQVWETNRKEIKQDAQTVANRVSQHLSAQSLPEKLGTDVVNSAIARLLSVYDSTHGGFGSAPKFPQPPYLELLIGVGWDNPAVRDAVTHTLDRMAMGGMYDQVGGGFHRYSTDGKWLVPHFEKMLYDNGQLASVYADAYEKSGDHYYGAVVSETLDYVLREMTSPEGAFYSAQDAEVNAREGQNYLWKPEQVKEALAAQRLADQYDFVMKLYGLDEGTNFQDPHHQDEPPANVLYLSKRPDEFAKEFDMTASEFHSTVTQVNEALLLARMQRDQPGLDDKTLTSWNGLMIAGMADGGRVLENQKCIDAAAAAADFILNTMRTDDGSLLRSYRDGETSVNGFLVDYAMMIRGLLALHEANNESGYLEAAKNLAAKAKVLFWDQQAGAYFDTLADQSDLFVRTRSAHDGAVPSGNSVMLNNLITLHKQTGEQHWLDDAETTLNALSGKIKSNPVSMALSTLALHRMIESDPQRLPAGPQLEGGRTEVITLSANTDSVTVSPEQPAEFEVTIDLAQGYHINAREPGQADLIPLDIQIVGDNSVTAKVEYPQGELYQDELRIHQGEVSIPVTLTANESAQADNQPSGVRAQRPVVLVTYQVCTDKVCLQPQRQVLEVAIDVEK